MSDLVERLRSAAESWKRTDCMVAREVLSEAALLDEAADEITGLKIALDLCVDKGSYDMVVDALRGLVDALAANDEDGLTEFADVMVTARKALSLQPQT